MITGRARYNIYLLALGVAVAALAGCRTHSDKKDKDKDKELATFRVHVEATSDDPMGTSTAKIFRASPIEMQVEKDAFLTEADVTSARVVDVLGGFDLQVQLGQEGTWMLQNYSASNPGKHYAIFSQFGKDGKQARWLAAPIFKRLIADGLIQFTPDASREEAEEIAKGLNNYAKKNKNNQKW